MLGLDNEETPRAFRSQLAKAALEPKLVHEIDQCEYDSSTRVLTTPQDKKTAETSSFKQMSFFQDVIGQMKAANKAEKPGAKATYAAAEAVFNLDGDRSTKTMHQANDKNYTNKKPTKGTNQAGEPHPKAQDADDEVFSLSSDSSSSSSSSSSSGSSDSSLVPPHASVASPEEMDVAGRG